MSKSSGYSQGQDWESAGWGSRAPPRGAAKQAALNSARRTGNVVTETKHNAGTNKGAHSAANVNMRKLEEDTDNFKHDAVDRSLSQALMKARMAKKMNQKQLGTLINEKPQVIAEYESGRAIPNGQIISKLNRALGVQLPRGPKKKKAAAN
ncbi:helix-turn-helix protein [Phytophthora infestans]|uniref:Helix-turn-helix protein n=1 Tax=Phytophthora infestans TaxID=4787 RepID=A0A833SWB4_PHYIN|nr:helix-turn-helix protein [Phytophthora infestans]